MKQLLIIVSIFALAACSSTPEETPVEAPVMADSAPAPEPTPEPAPADTMVADTGANMDGGFPDVEGTERSGATCKNGSDERLVSVIDTKEGPCGVVYTKAGSKRTVAYAKYDMGFCDKVYNNVVGNLSNGGFDCGGAGAAAPVEEAAAEVKEAATEAASKVKEAAAEATE